MTDTLCEECGSPARWCCVDEHVRVCERHYTALCERMNADPVRCPLRSEMMRCPPVPDPTESDPRVETVLEFLCSGDPACEPHRVIASQLLARLDSLDGRDEEIESPPRTCFCLRRLDEDGGGWEVISPQDCPIHDPEYGELATLRAENERLEQSLRQWEEKSDRSLQRADAEKAEQHRLQMAVQEIDALDDKGSDTSASHRFHDAKRIAAAALAPTPTEQATEAEPETEDDSLHRWRFDGEDPYVICDCGARRDALTGRVITKGKGHAEPVTGGSDG